MVAIRIGLSASWASVTQSQYTYPGDVCACQGATPLLTDAGVILGTRRPVGRPDPEQRRILSTRLYNFRPGSLD